MRNRNIKPEPEVESGEPEAGLPTAEMTEPEASAAALRSAQEALQQAREAQAQAADQLLRKAAEFDNYRKRVQRDMVDLRPQVVADTLRYFLPVLDGFERALSVPSEAAEDFRKGIELIHRQLCEVTRKLGLEPIAAVGQPFDPHVHEAIEMVETDAAPDHSVVEELQKGYRLKERLVRPAMVRVARHPNSPDTQS